MPGSELGHLVRMEPTQSVSGDIRGNHLPSFYLVTIQ
jgi:hypothetical protein